MMTLHRFCFGLLVLLASSCGPNLKDAGVDTDALNDEIQNMKIKRVTSAQLRKWLDVKAPQLTDTLDQDLKKQLSKDLSIQSLVAQYNTPLSRWLSKKYGVKIQLIHLDSVPKGSSEKLAQVWVAYLYNVRQKAPIQQNLQKEKNQFFFTKEAIVKQSPPLIWLVTFDKVNIIKSFDPKDLN